MAAENVPITEAAVSLWLLIFGNYVRIREL